MRSFENLVWHLLVGTRGGKTRTAIAWSIHNGPGNLNQIARKLSMDYKTIKYHVELMYKNNLLSREGDTYGATYFLSETFNEHIALLESIRDEYGPNLGKRS